MTPFVSALVQSFGPRQAKLLIKISVVSLLVLVAALALVAKDSQRSPRVSDSRNLNLKRSAVDNGVGDEGDCLSLDEYKGDPAKYCEFVEESCQFSRIPYVAFYYDCKGSLSRASVYIIMFVLILVWFYLMSKAASEYFCPALEIFTEKLKLSEDVAGVTFLALGNGISDVATTFEAVRGGEFNIAIGELLGAALFISSGVLSLVVLFGKVPLGGRVEVQRIPFIRDVSMLMVGVCIMLAFVYTGSIPIYLAIIPVAAYLAYVLVVVVYHYYKENKKSKRVPSVMDDVAADSATERESLLEPIEVAGDEKENDSDFERAVFTFADWWSDFKALSSLNKILYVVSFPLNFLLALSTPAVKQWNRYAMLFVPICGMMFTLFATNFLDLYLFKINGKNVLLWMPVGIVGLLLGIALFMTSEWTHKPRYYDYVFVPFSCIFSMVWIYFAANELVAVLQTLGVVLDISSIILGATVLAWGNSLGDVVANVIMARQGAPKMALAACFAGPCFNLLFGMGLSLMYSTIRTYPVPYDVSNTAGPIYYATNGFVLICLAVSLVVVTMLTDFSIPKAYAIFLFSLYAIYNAFVLLTVLGVLARFGIKNDREVHS